MKKKIQLIKHHAWRHDRAFPGVSGFHGRSILLRLGLIAVLLTAMTLPSCSGKKEIKRPSLEAKIADEAFALADSLKKAYINKDRAALEALCTRNGFLTIIGKLKDFDSATLDFTPRWIDMEKDKVILYVQWSGKWEKGGRTFREKGLSAFVLTGSPLKLNDILRANPFKYPET